MTRKRSIASIINDETQVNRSSGRSTRKGRTRLRCHCSKCNGSFVDPRTKVLHDLKDQNSAGSSFNKSTTNFDMNMIQENELELESVISHESQERETADHQFDRIQQNTQEHETADGSEFIFLPRRSKRRVYNNRRISAQLPDHEDHEDHEDSVDEETEFTTEDDRNRVSSDDGSTSGEDFEIFEDYSCPEGFEPFHDPTATRTTNDDRFLWILIWIMSFRTRFNLPETATESLLKFMKLVLKEIGGADFDEFPDTLYLIKKALDLKDRFHNFAACPKCHKLYKKQEVRDSSVTNCQHIEYPNSKTRRTRLCQTALSRPTRLLNGQISNQPILIYPFAGIKQQLESMYCRPGFENLLRHWVNRTSFDQILADIYDGQVWKTLKDENSANFFRPDTADSNLGLMLNLDWFQPFEGTMYSTGVIYIAICNLPRDVRFKRENLLIIGLLPGPHEVSLHKINHYLAPIVDELETLWAGVSLNRTFEFPDGRDIRAALILTSCDIPAARKICGHVSALVSCHRCEKKANYENRQHNFAGMDDMDEWFVIRDSAKHRQDVIGWRTCKSDAARKRFVKQTGVRWSELLRLPYFDPIRFIIVDPMHCLFLGIANGSLNEYGSMRDY